MMYTCKNYRPNDPPRQMPGACAPHPGQILADLYDEDGKFYRTAVVSDLGSSGLSAAWRYCRIRNVSEIKEIVEEKPLAEGESEFISDRDTHWGCFTQVLFASALAVTVIVIVKDFWDWISG